jgi:hypothetical protein
MTKRVAIALIAGLAICGPALAAPGEGTSVTFKTGFFFPGGDVFRAAYSSGPFFGAEVAVPVGGPFRVWGGAEIFGKTGRLPVSEERTKATIASLFAGVRAEFGKRRLRPYVGAAAAYFLLHETNPLGAASESGFGLISQAGLRARIARGIWLDAFAGYRACTIRTGGDEALEADIGGLSAGLGLGFGF